MVDLFTWQVGLTILFKLLLVGLLRVGSWDVCAEAGLNLISLPNLGVLH